MAYTDALLDFSSSQTVVGSLPVLGTNAVDIGGPFDIGQGGLPVWFRVNATFAGLTALEMQVVTADDATLVTNVEVIGSTGPRAVATLLAGAQFVANIQPLMSFRTSRRYIGVRYVPTGTGTAGTISAGVSLTPGSQGTTGKIYGGGATFKVL